MWPVDLCQGGGAVVRCSGVGERMAFTKLADREGDISQRYFLIYMYSSFHIASEYPMVRFGGERVGLLEGGL